METKLMYPADPFGFYYESSGNNIFFSDFFEGFMRAAYGGFWEAFLLDHAEECMRHAELYGVCSELYGKGLDWFLPENYGEVTFSESSKSVVIEADILLIGEFGLIESSITIEI